MQNIIRAGIGAIGILLAILSLWLLTQPESFARAWPWDSYGQTIAPLSFYFLSSIAAAISAPLLWIAVTGSLHASPGGALNLALTFTGFAVYLVTSYLSDPENTKLAVAAAVVGASALANVGIFLKTQKLPSQDDTPQPLVVRYSFAVISVVLVLVGAALISGRQNILPWDMSDEAGVVYGWVFLGASIFYLYAIVKREWEYSIGPLLGLLAYDAILIVPFIQHFGTVAPQQKLSLIVYFAVVSSSSVLAAYYLFACPSTRIVGRGRH